MKSALPYVLINMAMTADGKIATANRAVTSCGSKHDFAHLLELRATADAVMSGARTVDSGPINLGPGAARYRKLRIKRGLAEYNLRIIVSGSGSIDPKSEIFRHRFSPIIILTRANLPAPRLKKLRELAEDVGAFGKDKLNFPAALRWLRKKWNVKRLLCEGGGELNDALFRSNVVDELHLTICPKIFAGQNAPTITDGTGFSGLASAAQLQLKSFCRNCNEAFLIFRVK